MVEGGSVLNKTVVLVEDLVTTGASSLSAVNNIRKAGGKVSNCLVIVKYNFPKAKYAFSKSRVKLHAVTSFPVILEEAKKLGVVGGDTLRKVEDWFAENTK